MLSFHGTKIVLVLTWIHHSCMHCREENQQKHDIWDTLVTLMTSGTHSCGATLVWLQPGQRRNPWKSHTLMSQRVHLLPNGLEVEGISCEIWCQDNMLFVPWDTSCSHSFKQSSPPATYSSWLTNQSLGIPSVRWHMWRWRICIFAKKPKTKHWTMGKIQQNGDF